ncbi:MAG: tetratricopeptide repeat protein [Dysgonamonadaceae bacterium]|jgi:tetratricopeptide (TPR) repeat protein|nr:tetratricopeptide repeat protein [Dysgonamonadaceae bacterium]
MATSATNAEQNVGEILSRSEKFIETYRKQIITGIGAIILLVVLVMGIRYFYLIPKEREAENMIFKGENYFSQTRWDIALYGDSIDYLGFEEIINQYGFTKTANLAKAYAGICYYKTGDLESAVKYLKKFSAGDKMISPAITALIGDCMVDMGKVKEGISCFIKAANKADNPLLSPLYLKKAGLAYESEQEYGKALGVYTRIKEKFPTSQEGNTIDKYIDRVRAMQ